MLIRSESFTAHQIWLAACEEQLRAADTTRLKALLDRVPSGCEPNALFYRGWLASDGGDFAGAAQLFYEGRRGALLAGRAVLERRCMAWEAYVEVQCGNYAHARSLTDALDRQTPLEDSSYGDIFFVRGILAAEQETLAAAQGWMERALEVAQRFHDVWLEARCYANLAPILSSQGQIERALGAIRRAEEVHRRSGEPMSYQRQLQLANLLVYAYRWAGEVERALDEGLARCGALDERSTLFSSYLLLTTAAVATDLGDFAQAETLWAQAAARVEAIQDDQRTLAELLWEQAWLRYRQGDLAGAQRSISEALELVDDSMETECFHAYVIQALIALRAGDVGRAGATLRRASERFGQVGHRIGLVGVLLHLAAYYLRDGRPEPGRKALAEALLLMWSQQIYGTYYWEPSVVAWLCQEAITEEVWGGDADALLAQLLQVHRTDVAQAVEFEGSAANLFAEFATSLAIKRLAHDHWRAFVPLLDHRLERVRGRAARILQHSDAPQARIYLMRLLPEQMTIATTQEPSAAIQIVSFGKFQVTLHGRPLSLPSAGTAKAMVLLAVLLIVGSEGISRDDLNCLLWPGKTSFTTLNTTNSALRKAFAHACGNAECVRLVSRGDRYTLEWDEGALWWDWQVLESIAAQQRPSVRQRREAEQLYHPDWMPLVEQWLPPRDLDPEREEQWHRIANTLRQLVDERRETAAAWMAQIRRTG